MRASCASRKGHEQPTGNVSNVTTDLNSNLTRLDFFPQIRYPFKKWQWFTVNTTLSWRDTYYSSSLDRGCRRIRRRRRS